MLPEVIPDDLPIPTVPIGMQGLATLYNRSIRTLQRAFKKKRIHEIIGEKCGYDFTPLQQLMIFYLYFPPAKYYKSYLWLEQYGYIDKLVEKYGLDTYKKKRDGK